MNARPVVSKLLSIVCVADDLIMIPGRVQEDAMDVLQDYIDLLDASENMTDVVFTAELKVLTAHLSRQELSPTARSIVDDVTSLLCDVAWEQSK